MNEYIKYFDNLDQAEGYEIKDIPFSGYVKDSHLALLSKRQGDIKEGEVSYARYLFYTTKGGGTIKLKDSSGFPELMRNEYRNGEGAMRFSDSITSIGSFAFEGRTSLTSVIIPNSVTSIGISAFIGCSSLKSITIPNSVTSIGAGAFNECSSLTSVTIPSSVTSIGNYAFQGCFSLTSVTIPNSVTSIGSAAFYNCSSLTSVTIPNSVTSIEINAFYGCSFLTSITCKATTPPRLGSNNYLSNVTAVYVPADSVEAYKTATNWSSYSGVIQPI